MICGNEEALIERCLNSVKPIAGEICLVEAQGNVAPDKTAKIFRAWCVDNGVPFYAGIYDNRKEFPHVDDFAAARNLSFSLATLPWQMWLDCDDIITPENAQRILELKPDKSVDAYYFGYRKQDGSTCPRERLIRTGNGRWEDSVHETCRIASGRTVLEPSIEILHAPLVNDRPENCERNFRLLTEATRNTPRQLFYLHEDQHKLKKPEAIVTGKAALLLLDSDKGDEKYEILLNLSELEPNQSYRHLLDAVALQPYRREALAYLVQNSLRDGQLSAAVAYFKMMDALPLPEPLPWTHRGIFHGWARNFLRVQILRALGKTEQAETEHAEFSKDAAYKHGTQNLT